MAIALALTGCSASPETPLTAETTAPASASASTTPKVMSLKSNAEEPTASAARPSADEAFYFKTFDLWKSEGRDLPSDEELLKLGYKYCVKLDAGEKRLDVIVFGGKSQDAVDLNNYLGASAVSALCPEYL